MNYETEFYKSIEKEIMRIKHLDISEKERDKLYLLVEETTERYEANKKLNLKKTSRDLHNALDKVGNNLGNFVHHSKKLVKQNPALEKITSKIKATRLLRNNPHITN